MNMPVFDHCLSPQNDHFIRFKVTIAQQVVLLVLVLLLLLKDNHSWPRRDLNLNLTDRKAGVFSMIFYTECPFNKLKLTSGS